LTPYFREPVFRSWQREKNRKFRNWYEEEKKGFARSLIEGYQRVLKHFASASFGLEPVDAFRALDPSFVIFHEIKETLKDRGIAGQDQLHRKLGEFLHSTHLRMLLSSRSLPCCGQQWLERQPLGEKSHLIEVLQLT